MQGLGFNAEQASMQARLIRREVYAINVAFCPFGYFSTTMCPKLRKCTRYRMVALARDRVRSKKMDTVRKAEVIGSVHTTMFARIEAGLLGKTALHRNPASMQNRLVRDKPAGYFGFYPRRACM